MADKAYESYKSFYAKLIRFYPKSFQQRFAEPMLQTFGDMCRERVEARESLGAFALKIYLETILQILKEQLKEVVKIMKYSNKRATLIGGSIVAILAIGVIVGTLRNTDGNIIKPGSTIEQAQKKAEGKKVACLASNEDAIKAVEKNDKIVTVENVEFSNFGTTVTSGIIDVPAGTNADQKISSYTEGIAKGSLIYDGNYGDYNFEMKYLGQPGEWELVSLTPCE